MDATERARLRERHTEHPSNDKWCFYCEREQPCDANALLDAVERLEKERNEARDWVRKMIHEGQELRCAFCGETYPPGTPTANDDALTAHIRVCAQHPMRELEADLAAARAERDAARADHENMARLYADMSRRMDAAQAECERLRGELKERTTR